MFIAIRLYNITMSHLRKSEKLQQDYLVAERKERERLTAQLVDESYQWIGSFD
jgi:hypothetical protein